MSREIKSRIDWILLLFTLPIMTAGLLTMYSFGGDASLFWSQVTWIGVSLLLCFLVAMFDVRFLKNSKILTILFMSVAGLLVLVLILGHVSNGAKSWISFGGFSFQPSDLAKLVLILVLAKYFSRRHVEIGHLKHILISSVYALILGFLILRQPDFGSAIIIFAIWFFMTLLSGLSKKHLIAVALLGVTIFSALWLFVFRQYQKDRIMTFIHPLTDIHGSGYNAFQSTIAVGSGEVLGKGVGFGTQSRLQFLPEYETDFVFAAFAEEWGFVGSIILLICYAGLLFRILSHSLRGASNFEILFGMGLAMYFGTHILINIGMNIGLMPVTGITLPFMSYGGSHLLAEFLGLGILMGMRSYGRTAHRDDMRNEFVGY